MSSLDWISQLDSLMQKGQSAILVTIAEHRGSTPRNAGTKMIVTDDNCHETIGGGHLEHKAIKHAREMLKQGVQHSQLEHFSLGASLGQCCGGAITLLFEPINPPALTVALFGAGHVARALIKILGSLPCRILWIDGREDEFPNEIPSNTSKIVSDAPEDEVYDLPESSYVLVMTHNHQLDQLIVEAALRREDTLYLGMIGSQTKRRKCEHRLRHKAFTEQQINQLTCPIGLSLIQGKLPGEIAVSIAAELINTYQIREKPKAINSKEKLSTSASVHKLA